MTFRRIYYKETGNDWIMAGDGYNPTLEYCMWLERKLSEKTANASQLELLGRRLPSEKQIEKEALKRCTEISMNYVHPINKKWFIKGARWAKELRQSA